MTSKEQIRQLFDSFRIEVDEHHERRERLIKISRDVTVSSKKVIFLLHRLVIEAEVDLPLSPEVRAAQAAQEPLHRIRRNMISKISCEVQGSEYWRYQRQISPGIQEYIEAIAFAHFLGSGRLITYNEMIKWLSDDQGVSYIPLPLDDFLLGLSDLTGELMRFAITAVGRRNGRSKAGELCTFVRGCSADFELFMPYVGGLSKKQLTTTQSLKKIEEAAYAIAVRGLEYDDSPEMVDRIVGRYITGRRFPEPDRFIDRDRSDQDDEGPY